MAQFIIQGGHELKGEVSISGSKNAALPILSATLLSQEPSILENVPDIADIHSFINIMNSLGAIVSFENGTVHVDPSNLKTAPISHEQVKKMRASILLLGPLLGRFKEVRLAFPGGCVLGKRSIHAHLHALENLGANLIESDDEEIHLKTERLKANDFIMWEASVTATENAVMTAVMAEGTTTIGWSAMEPHVQDLCHFLCEMGAEIEGIGTPTLTIHGGKKLHGAKYSVTPDYLETGTFVIAGVLTNSNIKIKNTRTDQLDSFWQKLEEIGANVKVTKNQVETLKHNGLKGIEKLQTSVYPGFATDLQAPFSVLLTQCTGESRIFETLFEGRLNYLHELERMGAKVEIQNPHQAVVHGPTTLNGAPITSCDIRAGAAMVLASLVAQGETIISDINYIDRGYERLDEKLRSLGAKIERQNGA